MVHHAHAKINLRLRVLAREASGFHQLETILLRIGLADTIDIERSNRRTLDVSGKPAGDLEENLVWRAAHAFYRRTALEPAARIHLHKRIPPGAGLGGGSSDAATTLHALNALHGKPLTTAMLLELAIRLGSDVPFFVAGAACAIAWGRGERVLALPPPPAAPALVVTPARRIATADAYAALAALRPDEPTPVASLLTLTDTATWDRIAEIAGNDFEPVADAMVDESAPIRRSLLREGAFIAQLTGSGSAHFGIFGRSADRDRAAAALGAAFPDACIVATETMATTEAA